MAKRKRSGAWLRRGGGHLGGLEHNECGADLNLIAGPHLALVDASSVDQRAGFIAQVDQRDVGERRYLDHGMHTRRELVVHAQMAARVFADLHDVLRNRVAANELIPLIQREGKRDFRLSLTFHR
jgi:hypothetical protein